MHIFFCNLACVLPTLPEIQRMREFLTFLRSLYVNTRRLSSELTIILGLRLGLGVIMGAGGKDKFDNCRATFFVQNKSQIPRDFPFPAPSFKHRKLWIPDSHFPLFHSEEICKSRVKRDSRIPFPLCQVGSVNQT